jgi:hypothetical protein
MLTCKEVSSSIAGDGLERSGWWRRLEVRMHLLMCRYCRRYAAQIRAVNAATRGLFERTVPDRETVARLQGSILDSLRDPEDGAGKRGE